MLHKAKAMLPLLWLKCACVIGLDVGSFWFDGYYFLSARQFWVLAIVICDLLLNGNGMNSSFKEWWTPALTITLILLLRRVLNANFSRAWMKILLYLSQETGTEHNIQPCKNQKLSSNNKVTVTTSSVKRVNLNHPTTTTNMHSFLSIPESLAGLIFTMIDGGPLGAGCRKVVTVLVGFAWLWALNLGFVSALIVPATKSLLPCSSNLCRFGPWVQSWHLSVLVIFLSISVNFVLWLWSSWAKKARGKHVGVNRMVKATLDRHLSAPECVMLLFWSFVNATCEEVEYRVLKRWEFSLIFGLAEENIYDAGSKEVASNICQAISFGLPHYHGVPSGYTGVVLTTTYGLLMATLQDTGGGIFYPLLTHTIADFFIFSQIARRQQTHVNK